MKFLFPRRNPALSRAPQPARPQLARLAALAGVMLLAAFTAPDAHAAIITYTNETAFLNALQPGYYRETFASLSVDSPQPNPSTFSRNGFSYQVSAPTGLYSGPPGLPAIGAISASEVLTTTITGGFVNAIGVNTFSGDNTGNPNGGAITLAFSNGQTQTFNSTTPSSFFGVIDTSAAFTFFTATPSSGSFANITNLTVGTAATAPVPEPSTWAMMALGVGAMGLVMRRKRDSEADQTN